MQKVLFTSLITLFIFLILAGCGITRSITKEIPKEENKPPEAYFCQREDCEAVFAGLAKNASEIKCAIYNIDLKGFVNALRNAQVVVEDEYLHKIENELNARSGKSRGLMHNKFCVFDGETVWTGSLNPTERNVEYANNAVVIYSKYLAQNYEDEFAELWNSADDKEAEYPKIILNGKQIENFFCPEDNCKENVMKTLETAEESIYFIVSSFTDDDIGNLLIEKAEEGIELKGIFDKAQNKQWSEYPKLKKYSVLRSKIHHKVFIIDGKIVITGSYNPSRNGDENNDENIVIIHDENVASRFLGEFEFLFS